MIGLVLYGFLRLSYGVYYGPFGVTPEEIGLGYFEILAQSVFGALILATGIPTLLAAYVLIATPYLKWIQHITGSLDDIGRRLANAFETLAELPIRAAYELTASLVEVVTAPVRTARRLFGFVRRPGQETKSQPDAETVDPNDSLQGPPRGHRRVDATVTPGPAQSNVQLPSPSVDQSEADQTGPEAARFLEAVRFGNALVAIYVIAAIITLGLVLPNVAIDRSDEVRRGEPANSVLLGRIPVLQLRGDPAYASWIGSEPSHPDLSGRTCLLFLGQAQGTAVLYDFQDFETIRVPATRVVIRTLPWQLNHGLDESC